MTPEALAELAAQVAEAQATNDAAFAEFARQGMVIDQALVHGVRLQVLTDVLLGKADDPDPGIAHTRLEYELACQDKFTEVIVNLRHEISKARLLQGVRLANGAKPG
jgi:hypothetical protein